MHGFGLLWEWLDLEGIKEKGVSEVGFSWFCVEMYIEVCVCV